MTQSQAWFRGYDCSAYCYANFDCVSGETGDYLDKHVLYNSTMSYLYDFSVSFYINIDHNNNLACMPW